MILLFKGHKYAFVVIVHLPSIIITNTTVFVSVSSLSLSGVVDKHIYQGVFLLCHLFCSASCLPDYLRATIHALLFSFPPPFSLPTLKWDSGSRIRKFFCFLSWLQVSSRTICIKLIAYDSDLFCVLAYPFFLLFVEEQQQSVLSNHNAVSY